MVEKIFTLFIITFMVGGTLFRVLYSYCKSDIKNTKIKFFSCLGFYLITFEFTYDNKIQGFIFYEITIGLFYPIYSVIKTIVLIIIIEEVFMEVPRLRLYCFYISIFIFVFQLIYFYIGKI